MRAFGIFFQGGGRRGLCTGTARYTRGHGSNPFLPILDRSVACKRFPLHYDEKKRKKVAINCYFFSQFIYNCLFSLIIYSNSLAGIGLLKT